MSGEASHRDDAALVQAALASDRSAREALAARLECVATMVASLHRRFGRPLADSDLHDLAQETLLKVWQKLDTFNGASRLETWVFQFCFLELKNAMRRGQRRQDRERPLADGADLAAAAPAEPLHDLERVVALLDRLPAEDAEWIRLRHFEGLEFESIAQRCGRPANTVKTRYHRALMKLRRWLGVAPLRPEIASAPREAGA
ncbi:MAG: RNA polymerase sigma factor [Planctomycetes bacterium]|nr:RNA polymerase sigma factor [Planctomycetota bacterium]